MLRTLDGDQKEGGRTWPLSSWAKTAGLAHHVTLHRPPRAAKVGARVRGSAERAGQ